METANASLYRVPAPVPARAGAGLKALHYQTILDELPDIGWFEIHPENYMGRGGAPLRYLEQIRQHYPISLHSVGTSLGSHLPLDRGHLNALKRLADRFEPGLVSEHLSWSHGRDWYTHDLLPLVYTEEALDQVVSNIVQVQDTLQRQILVENPSSYLQFKQSGIPEQEFLVEAIRRSGAGLLLDVNNAYVSCRNHGWNIEDYLVPVEASMVGEIHLAGHSVQVLGVGELLVDDHGSPVCNAVWSLYRNCIDRFGPVPTLIERDSNIPAFEELQQEVAFADRLLGAEPEVMHVCAG